MPIISNLFKIFGFIIVALGIFSLMSGSSIKGMAFIILGLLIAFVFFFLTKLIVLILGIFSLFLGFVSFQWLSFLDIVIFSLKIPISVIFFVFGILALIFYFRG